jgi:3-hydroxybutyryl-coA dehydrogenase
MKGMKKQNKVVVAGAGTMGASLAQVYARAGWDTVLYNRSASGLERAKNLIRLNQETFVKEEILTAQESEDLLARIKMTTEKADFADAALVVENIVEDLDAKQAFWGEISQLAPEDALLATNTSGLHITDIAKACKHPERFMGQHWLNPPHLLPLCEIIAGEKTSPENVQKMRTLVESLDKQPVVVADINGFIINRIQFALLREALHIVDIGAATFEDVDTVLKAGMGLRYAALGPFGVADFGGLDTFDHINSYLNAELDDSKVGNKRLHEMVEAGKLGVKSGQGFYDYSGDQADAAIRERDRLYIELAKVLYFKK